MSRKESQATISVGDGFIIRPLSAIRHRHECRVVNSGGFSKIFDSALAGDCAGGRGFSGLASCPTSNAKERLQFAIPVPGEVSHMALSRDGSMLVFVFPEEKSGLPVLG
jgi:hypothetical protein